MRIKIWGVRGSLPAPLPPYEVEKRLVAAMELFFDRGLREKSDVRDFVRGLHDDQLGGFGGNTPCVEVSTPSTHMIIDGGTGIRRLGNELMKGPCREGRGVVHLFFTHFHWDHLIGLPFFIPFFIPGNEIHLYAVQDDVSRVIPTLFQKPFFPVSHEKLGATITCHSLRPRQPHRHGDITITPYLLDHPDPCWGYRIESGGKAFAHCVDGEMSRFSREELGPDLPLYQGLDLMIFDAQYALVESIRKATWGHGTAMTGLDLAAREGVKRVLFMHHDPSASDERIHGLQQVTQKYHETQVKQAHRNQDTYPHLDWSFAREEMVIDL